MPRSSTTFAAGNRVAVRHGANSAEVAKEYVPLAVGEIKAAIEASVPHYQPVYEYVVELAARRLVQLRAYHRFVEQKKYGWIDSKGRVLKCAEHYDRAERAFITLSDRLGMSPAARSSLMASLGLRSAPAMEAAQAAQARLRAKVQRDLEEREADDDGVAVSTDDAHGPHVSNSSNGDAP